MHPFSILESEAIQKEADRFKQAVKEGLRELGNKLAEWRDARFGSYLDVEYLYRQIVEQGVGKPDEPISAEGSIWPPVITVAIEKLKKQVIGATYPDSKPQPSPSSKAHRTGRKK